MRSFVFLLFSLPVANAFGVPANFDERPIRCMRNAVMETMSGLSSNNVPPAKNFSLKPGFIKIDKPEFKVSRSSWTGIWSNRIFSAAYKEDANKNPTREWQQFFDKGQHAVESYAELDWADATYQQLNKDPENFADFNMYSSYVDVDIDSAITQTGHRGLNGKARILIRTRNWIYKSMSGFNADCMVKQIELKTATNKRITSDALMLQDFMD